MILLKKNQIEKITSKNTNRTLRDTNADKTTVLLSELRNNYVIIVGYCCKPYTKLLSVVQPFFDQVRWCNYRFELGGNLAEGNPLANTQKIVEKQQQIRCWTAIKKNEITGKHTENRKKVLCLRLY